MNNSNTYLDSNSFKRRRRSAGPSPNKQMGSLRRRKSFFTSTSSVLTLICRALRLRSNSSSSAILSLDLELNWQRIRATCWRNTTPPTSHLHFLLQVKILVRCVDIRWSDGLYRRYDSDTLPFQFGEVIGIVGDILQAFAQCFFQGAVVDGVGLLYVEFFVLVGRHFGILFCFPFRLEKMFLNECKQNTGVATAQRNVKRSCVLR